MTPAPAYQHAQQAIREENAQSMRIDADLDQLEATSKGPRGARKGTLGRDFKFGMAAAPRATQPHRPVNLHPYPGVRHPATPPMTIAPDDSIKPKTLTHAVRQREYDQNRPIRARHPFPKTHPARQHKPYLGTLGIQHAYTPCQARIIHLSKDLIASVHPPSSPAGNVSSNHTHSPPSVPLGFYRVSPITSLAARPLTSVVGDGQALRDFPGL
jgi:hypothetical protein